MIREQSSAPVGREKGAADEEAREESDAPGIKPQPEIQPFSPPRPVKHPARRVFAIDPGCHESAWCLLIGNRVHTGKEPNQELLEKLRLDAFEAHLPAIEMLAGSYGQAVGLEVMQTAVWVGRFAEALETAGGPPVALIFRKTAVSHVTGNPKANDSHVRQALIDRWGGDSVALSRTRKCAHCKGRGLLSSRVVCPRCGGTKVEGSEGPLRGVTKDGWAALAIAVTAQETDG